MRAANNAQGGRPARRKSWNERLLGREAAAFQAAIDASLAATVGAKCRRAAIEAERQMAATSRDAELAARLAIVFSSDRTTRTRARTGTNLSSDALMARSLAKQRDAQDLALARKLQEEEGQQSKCDGECTKKGRGEG